MLDVVAPDAVSPDAVAPDAMVSGAAYSVSRIRYVVDGPTRVYALVAVMDIEVGQRYSSVSALESRLARSAQDLRNRRVFDAVQIDWVPIAPDDPEWDPAWEQESAIPIEVRVQIDDGWTLLPIPFYRYNSNSGHNPFVVLYWDNILGSLTDFGLSAGYYSRNWIDPFAWDVQINWRRIRLWAREWNVGFSQQFNTTERAAPDGDLELSYTGYRTRVSLSTSFRLTDAWSYSVSPRSTFEYGFQTDVNKIDFPVPEDSGAFGFGHGLSTGRIDWVDNFRRGWSFSLGQDADWAPAEGLWWSSASVSMARHWIVPLGNPALSLRARHFWEGDRLGLGGVVRGVFDNRVFGQTILSANAQFTFELLDAERFAEIQIVPFVDAAVTRKRASALGQDDLALGVGFDLVTFPAFLRGFEARVSVGVDLRDLPRGVFDLGAYEIVVTETLQF